MTRLPVAALALLAALALACSTASTDATETPAAATTATPSATEATPTPQACSFETATPAVFASVLQVVTNRGGGTAFAIGDGEFLTAAHVVADTTSIELRNSRTSAAASIVGLEVDTDIAILRSDIEGIEPVSFGNLDDLAAGQAVGVAGYPTYVEDDPSVVSGLLSKVVEDPDLGFGTFLQTDAAVNPGNSGGPMFNECGDVIGMIIAKIVATEVEGISWAVAENTLQTALPRVRRKGPPEPGDVVDPSFVEVEPESRYIANTGGSGVSLRDDCVDGARIEGSWPEGAEVVRSLEGVGFCDGWSVVADLDAVSWVRDEFLSASPPQQAAQPPPTQPTSSAAQPSRRSQPTAQPPAQPTAAPTQPPPAPTPAGPPQSVVDWLQEIRQALLSYSEELGSVLERHSDGLIDEQTASAQAYAIEARARADSDTVLDDSNDLSSYSVSCEAARQWYGDALFYRGLTAGYTGLVYEFWPDVSFADGDAALEQSWDSFERGDAHLTNCLAGN